MDYMALLNFKMKSYTIHSLLVTRLDGVEQLTALHCNVPSETIKAQGDWKSLFYLDDLDALTEAWGGFSLKPMFM